MTCFVVLRKAIRLQEHLAAKEHPKGPKCDMWRVADATAKAAELSIQAAQIEAWASVPTASRSARSRSSLSKVPTAAERDRLKEENRLLRVQIETFRRQPPSAETDQQIATSSPAAPSAPADNNVIPMVETRDQKIARLRREAGGPQSLRSAFSLDGMSQHEGRGRFDFPTGRGGW